MGLMPSRIVSTTSPGDTRLPKPLERLPGKDAIQESAGSLAKGGDTVKAVYSFSTYEMRSRPAGDFNNQLAQIGTQDHRPGEGISEFYRIG